MHYTDLVQRTKDLPLGPTIVYELPAGRIEIRNLGVRHHALSPRPEFSMYLYSDGRELAPRHGDFFSDFLLKCDARPDLRLALTESCEQVCNGLSPSSLITSKHLPTHFAEAGEATGSFQTSRDQTAGLPTDMFLCGLQSLIRVYELNRYHPNPQEGFRGVFLSLEKGLPLAEALKKLQPEIRPGKYYFERTMK